MQGKTLRLRGAAHGHRARRGQPEPRPVLHHTASIPTKQRGPREARSGPKVTQQAARTPGLLTPSLCPCFCAPVRRPLCIFCRTRTGFSPRGTQRKCLPQRGASQTPADGEPSLIKEHRDSWQPATSVRHRRDWNCHTVISRISFWTPESTACRGSCGEWSHLAYRTVRSPGAARPGGSRAL